MELLFASTALVISLTSLVWSVLSWRGQRQAASLVANHTNILVVESRIAEVPEILRFHGINDARTELARHGLSAEEFSYLLNNFTVGGTYYRTAPRAKAGIIPGSYRYKMCSSPATRRAWPLLRQMITESAYRDRLDEVFRDLERELPLEDAAQPAVAASDPSDRG